MPDEPSTCSGGRSMPSANRRTASDRSFMAASSISDQNSIRRLRSISLSASGSAMTTVGNETSSDSNSSALLSARETMNCSGSFIAAIASAPPSTMSSGGGGKVRLSGRNQTPADISRERTCVKMWRVRYSISPRVASIDRNGLHASRRSEGSGFQMRMTGAFASSSM